MRIAADAVYMEYLTGELYTDYQEGVICMKISLHTAKKRKQLKRNALVKRLLSLTQPPSKVIMIWKN